jgi:hypothetical protein
MSGAGEVETSSAVQPHDDAARRRATSLSPPDFLLLDQWGCHLWEVFDETPYCVGSVTRAARDYRDVDVRMLLPHGAEWIAATKIRLRAVNLGVSMWGRQATGLPIDFQFQPSDEFHGYDTERRHALGISWRVGVQEAWRQRQEAFGDD